MLGIRNNRETLTITQPQLSPEIASQKKALFRDGIEPNNPKDRARWTLSWNVFAAEL